MSAPWGLRSVGRLTIRLVPPGAPLWDPIARAFAGPNSEHRAPAPTLEVFGPGNDAPFGEFWGGFRADEPRDIAEEWIASGGNAAEAPFPDEHEGILALCAAALEP